MPAVSISINDLLPFVPDIPDDKAEAMIADALAMAALVAPCILDADFDTVKAGAAKAILRGAILRWHEAGQGVLSQGQQNVGPFGSTQVFDTRQPRRAMFWPSEVEALEKLCRTETGGGAWSYDTLGTGDAHAEWCAVSFGANYCDCGAYLYGYPLFSQPQP